MTESDIINALATRYWKFFSERIFCNIRLTHWESDLLRITPARYAHEVEVKLTCADFKRDAKKSNTLTGESRHEAMQGPDSPIRSFTYAMPVNLAELLLGDIPEYAGMIGVEKVRNRIKFHDLQKATFLPARKVTDEELNRMVESCYYRLWARRSKDFRLFLNQESRL